MKIVCGSCGAKYSISDDKVQGKVFKIRCRKCSNVIVVKGTADEEGAGASEASAGAYDGFGGGSSAAEWYVVIDGEQAGPLTPEELEAYHASGRVTLESFVWRDGMDDWKTLRDVDVFAHLAAYDTGGGYGAEEATQIAQIPVSNDSPAPASDYGAGDFEEDATAVVNTSDIPGVMNSEPAADPYDGYGDPTEAGQSYNEAELAAAAAGGYGGGYESNGYGQNGYDQGAGGYDQGDYGGGYEQNGYGDFGQDAGMAAAGVDLGGGYGQVGAGAGMSQYDEGGDQSDGMFSAFESQPSGGGDQGLAYQSFSGLDSGGGGIDLSGVDSNGAAGASPANDMIGSRNENSVLFSLSSLQQVEAVSADSAPAGGGAGGGGGGVTEGSGLIDIQALASSHAAMKSAGADDVLGGPTPETFSPGTMSVPAIMPRGSHRSNNGLMIAIAVIGLIAIVGIGGIGYYVFTKEDKPIEQKVIVKETVKVVEKEVPGNNGAAEAAAKAAMADASKADEGAQGEEVAAKSESKSGSKASTKKKSSSGSAAKKNTGSSSSPVVSKKKSGTTSKKIKGNSNIDSILSGLDKEDKKSSSASKKKDTGSTASAKKRSKSDISNTFKKYKGRFNACPNSGGLKPPVRIRLKIAPSGKVTSAKIDAKSSQFKGTDIGACAQKVARSMKFPAASNDSSFAYPVKF